MIELNTEPWRSNNVIYTYVLVDGKEVGYIAKDLKKKVYTFFYDDNETYDDRQSPDFATSKEMSAWLNKTFG